MKSELLHLVDTTCTHLGCELLNVMENPGIAHVMVPDLPMKEKLSKDRRSNLSKEIRKNSGKLMNRKVMGKFRREGT